MKCPNCNTKFDADKMDHCPACETAVGATKCPDCGEYYDPAFFGEDECPNCNN